VVDRSIPLATTNGIDGIVHSHAEDDNRKHQTWNIKGMPYEIQCAQCADIGENEWSQGNKGQLPVEELKKQQQGYHRRYNDQQGGKGGKEDISHRTEK
jgi:hypothetical protein